MKKEREPKEESKGYIPGVGVVVATSEAYRLLAHCKDRHTIVLLVLVGYNSDLIIIERAIRY